MKHTRKILMLLALAGAVLALAACGGGGDTSSKDTTDSGQTVAVEPSTGTVTSTVEETTTEETTTEETTTGTTTDSDGGTRTAVSNAAQKTADEGSLKLALDLKVAGLPQGDLELTGEGATDIKNQKADFTVDLAGLGKLAQSSSSSSQLPIPPDAFGKIQLLVDKQTVYVKWPFISTFLGGGKPWLKLEGKTVASSQGLDTSGLGSVKPDELLKSLQQAGDFEDLGSEQVRGEDAHHYKGTLDLNRAVTDAAGVSDAQKQKAEEQLAKSGVDALPLDVWIGDDGFLRKVAVTLDKLPSQLGSAASGLGGVDTSKLSLAVSLELFDYGTSVSIAAPAAADVADLSSTLGGLGGGGTSLPSTTGTS